MPFSKATDRARRGGRKPRFEPFPLLAAVVLVLVPGWGTEHSKAGETAGVGHFVRRLPRLTPEEVTPMEALDAKTPA